MPDSDNTVGVLRLLSFNIHAGTSTDRFHHYVTQSWRQILPHTQRTENLDSIAGLVSDYDIVALQEADAGSLRSGFINQSRYIAGHSGMPYWFHQANRKLGSMTFTSNGFLSRFVPEAVEEHRLPGAIPGRGALVMRFGRERQWVIAVVHLALGRRARKQQLSYLARHLEGEERLVVMGDFNTEASSSGVRAFCEALDLDAPTAGLPSYPSWQPQRAIDHILVSRGIETSEPCVVDVPMSDHCPVALNIRLPFELEAQAGGDHDRPAVAPAHSHQLGGSAG
ncbi:MAG: endonuclease/exonuclease/phosphatase family protein [Lysobacterales bacterium]|jgi:endonuclease/exonuclease/phosphatase family metal-dependent hydrolase